MESKRKYTQQKPPPGIAFIEDTKDEHGNVVVVGIASRLGITPGRYRKWRMAGKGPNGTFLLGKRVAAYIEDIDAWVAEQYQAAQQPSHDERPPEPLVPHGRRKTTASKQSLAA
jgi:hypothetical protein